MSNLPKIETFEHNIVEELKNKHATVVDIASMDGTVETKKEAPQSPLDINKIILVILFVLLIIAIIVFSILKFKKPVQAPPLTEENISLLTNQISFKDVSPTMNYNIGRFISSVSMVDNNYVIGLTSYSPVYSYMIKNENIIGKELRDTFKIETSSSSTNYFKDVTLSNQDMRVLSNDSEDIVYAFIGSKWLVISTSTQAVLTIKSAILSR